MGYAAYNSRLGSAEARKNPLFKDYFHRTPVSLCVYDWTAKKKLCSRALAREEIASPGFHFYRVGSVRLDHEDVSVYLDWTWCLVAPLKAAFKPDADTEWEVWVSLKFEGPVYADGIEPSVKGHDNVVFLDRVVLKKRK